VDKQEPVAVHPVRVSGGAEDVGVGNGENIGDAKCLADVALSLYSPILIKRF
jgi:hypothetical protein